MGAAKRIPREFAFDGSEVMMHREGQRLVLQPIASDPLTELLARPPDLDEEFPEIDDPPPEPVDLDL